MELIRRQAAGRLKVQNGSPYVLERLRTLLKNLVVRAESQRFAREQVNRSRLEQLQLAELTADLAQTAAPPDRMRLDQPPAQGLCFGSNRYEAHCRLVQHFGFGHYGEW
jgi:hypothetical protein